MILSLFSGTLPISSALRVRRLISANRGREATSIGRPSMIARTISGPAWIALKCFRRGSADGMRWKLEDKAADGIEDPVAAAIPPPPSIGKNTNDSNPLSVRSSIRSCVSKNRANGR